MLHRSTSSIDDLCAMGWYAESLASCLRALVDLNDEDVTLDIIIDKLPNEQGGDGNYKATLLRELCRRGSSTLLNLDGVPEKPDRLQRELLVDNTAGPKRTAQRAHVGIQRKP